jgi:hypothetical protein
MKQSWAAGLIVTAAFTVVAWANVADHKTAPAMVVLRLCYENLDIRPWQYRRGGGLDVQLLDRAAMRAGLSIQYEATLRQDCLARLGANEVDGVFGELFSTESQAALGSFAAQKLAAAKRLHVNGEQVSYLVLSDELTRRRPELVKIMMQSVESVRTSASYQILERQTLAALVRR